MDLAPYIIALRQELAAAAEAGGPEARELAERLVGPLESSVRLALLEALSAAAGEITRDLAPGSVDLRLRGREPSFVVIPPPTEGPLEELDEVEGLDDREIPSASASTPSGAEADDGVMSRINLRLTQDLKDRVEEAARGAGLSVNAWLVRAASTAVEAGSRAGSENGEGRRRSLQRTARGNKGYSGWVR